MRTSFILTITMIGLLHNVESSKLRCEHLFKDDYQLFFYRPSERDYIEQKTSIVVDVMEVVKGKIMTSVCENVTVPEGCPDAGKEAKFVFVQDSLAASSDKSCIVIYDNKSWTYELTTSEHQSQKITIQQPASKDHTVNYNFLCDEKADTPSTKVFYDPTNKAFTVGISSKDVCGIHLDLFKVLYDNSMITAISFTIIGVILCFFGLKLYKDFLMFFIPLLTLILGFYFYLSIVDNSSDKNERLMLVFFMCFTIMVVLTLAVLFSSVVFFLVCMASSYQLGLMAHRSLAAQFEFFRMEYTQWIVIVLIFLILFGLYLKLQDYFIIINTVIIGSCSLIMSLYYYKLTEFNLLFDIEINKFNLDQLNPVYFKMIGLFVLIALLGGLVQYVIFVKGADKHYNNDDLKIDLKITP